ncbi:MAG: Cadherin proteinputative collagen-binding protein, partial [Verrucomicrobiaceae bacterium]|nr:Cadherin proteinputative collagen-binding protein [Verrucomicrobiaceae bacterium]
VTPLTNGNYVAISADWNSGAGAVTWASGTALNAGTLSATNSLTGVVANEVVALPNGNFVVVSPTWDNSKGAATWGNGATGIVGTVSASNSLVGSAVGDEVGRNGVTVLTNSNYVVVSSTWNNGKGAVTWGNGTTGVKGVVVADNSLVGTTFGDEVGANDHSGGDRNGVVALTNGNYVVSSPNWNGIRGAATWGRGTGGVQGTISSSNSLVGSAALDAVSEYGITPLSDGDYVVFSPHWRSGSSSVGAVTLGDGAAGTSGLISAANSVIGGTANKGDTMVFDYLAPQKVLVVGRPADNILSFFTGVVLTPAVFTVSTSSGAVSDGGTQDFGNVFIGARPSIVFTITNTGPDNITSLLINKDGTDKDYFSVLINPPSTIASGATKTFTVTFTPKSPGAKTAALHIIANGVVADPFDITLTGTAKVAVLPVVTTTAATGIAFDGATLNGTVNAKGSLRNITFEYGLTTTALTSVTANPATLETNVATPVASAQLTGLAPHTKYNFRVKAEGDLGAATGAFLTFTTADRVPVTVEDSAVALPSAKITIHPLANDSDPDMDTLSIFSFTQPGVAVGTVVRSGLDLIFTPAAGFTGGEFKYIAADAFGGKSPATTVTLQLGTCVCPSTITAASDQAPVTITVEATAPFTVVEALPWLSVAPFVPNVPGDTQVTFIFAPNPSLANRSGVIKVGGQAVTVTQNGIQAEPVLDTPNPVADAAISASYDLAIVTHNGPVTYTATGLPTGLTLSNVTGHITGMPTVAGTKQVSITARNAKGASNTIIFPITVQAFPASLLGSYTATLPRSTGLVNNDLGGLLTFTVAANGPVTGTLKSGAGSYPFSGRLNTAVNPASPDPLHARLSVSIPRVRGAATPLLLVVNMNSPADGQIAGTVTLGANVVNFTGWQNVWSLTAHALATDYAGAFTAALQPSNASVSLPQGDGFLTFSMTTKGVITWNGQLADGTPLTVGTTNLGPNGEVPLFSALYAGKGSIL